MSRSTISTFQLFEKFPNEASAYVYVEKRLWPNGPVCPRCKAVERISKRGKGRTGLHCCNVCQREFTVKIGTIFEDSKVPLHKWIYAMYIVVTARKGVSSLQLAKEIGITQKSAWFVLQRLRTACGQNKTILQGIVEVDETFIGGLERNKHTNKKLNEGRGAVGKTAVIGMRQRGGDTVAMPIARNDGDTILGEIGKTVSKGSRHTTERLDSFVDAIAGKRITYAQLTKGKTWFDAETI